jgi:hypothetical protein
VDEFANAYPTVNIPPSFQRVAGLDARIKDFISPSSGKKGMLFLFNFVHTLNRLIVTSSYRRR